MVYLALQVVVSGPFQVRQCIVFLFQLEGSCRISTFMWHITTFQPEVSVFCVSLVWRWNLDIWWSGSLIKEHFQSWRFKSYWMWRCTLWHLVPDISKIMVPSSSESSSARRILLGLCGHDEEGIMILWNAGDYTPSDRAPCSWRRETSAAPVTILNVTVPNLMWRKSGSVLQQ